MFDPWLLVLPVIQAQLAADSARHEAELAGWLADEQARNFRRAGSIDVEARWVVDAPLLEAPKC